MLAVVVKFTPGFKSIFDDYKAVDQKAEKYF